MLQAAVYGACCASTAATSAVRTALHAAAAAAAAASTIGTQSLQTRCGFILFAVGSMLMVSGGGGRGGVPCVLCM